MDPASIRTKNPGAMWGHIGQKPSTFFATDAGPHGVETNAPIPLRWGSTQTIYLSDGLGQDNNAAIFPTWVQGICAQLDLWRTSAHYKNKRFADAIVIWCGGNGVEAYIASCKKRVPGLTEDTVMNDAFWQSPSGVAFLKAQARLEAGKEYPAPDSDWIEAQRRVFAAAPSVQPASITAPSTTSQTILQYVQAHGAISKGMYHSAIVRQAQAALLRDGRELVPDGDYGGITVTAVTKFQTDHQLNPVGYIGVKTAAALDAVPLLDGKSIIVPKPSVLNIAPWLSQMRAMNGLHEGASGSDNPVILKWPREIADKYPDLGPDVLWYNHDSIAWCGLGAGICATRGGEKPPRGLLGAGNWANFGQPMGLAQRTPGAIFVYNRVGGHHVTMYESEDSTYYYCRGANQSDSICVTRILKGRPVVAVRWGLNTPMSLAGPVQGATANSVPAGTEA